MTTSGAATSGTPHPQIVSREERVAERKKLLADEKEMTKHYDRVCEAATAADGEN